MEYDVSKIVPGAGFSVTGASYIGAPIPGTAMYISRKVERLLKHLEPVDSCLVFAESGMHVPEELLAKHCFVFTDNPQLSYAEFAENFNKEKLEKEKEIPFDNVQGSFISRTAEIGEGAIIEPGSVIGPEVVIGREAHIMAGCIIKNAKIGDGFTANERALIGANGFTMATDAVGNKCRIPSLGKVVIGDFVEVGAFDNISRGSAGDTVIEDYVKIDAIVHIGHDVRLEKNVEITAGCVIGGYDVIEEKAYIGLNSVLRNRIRIGAGTVVGMGSIVTKDVPAGITVIGNPARKMERE